MGLLDHRALAIIKGIGVTPGETAAAVTNELPPVVIDLLNETTGYSLSEWSPNIPSLKGGGVWADNPATDGRTLLAGADTNVIEDMTVILHGTINKNLWSLLSDLALMRREIAAYWEEKRQVQPVYLLWWANGAPGPQYAHLYSMDIDPVWEDSIDAVKINITLERDPYWSGEVPPGDNPKRWTLYANGQPYNATLSDIGPGGAPFIAGNANLQNMNEYSDAGKTTLLTKNFVDVDVSAIPGDAPALCWLYMQFTGGNNIHAGVHSFMPQVDTIPDVNSFNASDATTGLGADATIVNDTGGMKPAGGANSQRVEISFTTTTTDALRITFDAVPVNEFIGNWSVFVRARQVTGTAGQVTMYVKYGPVVSASEGIRLPTQTAQLLGTSGATTAWGLHYMGVMTIPHYPSKASQLFTGQGLNEENDLSIGLFAAAANSTPDLYVGDLILIPFDEWAFNAFPETASYTDMLVDSTRYSSRGLSTDYAAVPQTSNFVANTTLRGRALQLQPKQTNRIYFLIANNAGTQSDVDDIILPQVQIVPRWSGVRDV